MGGEGEKVCPEPLTLAAHAPAVGLGEIRVHRRRQIPDAAKEVLEVPHGGRVRVYGRTRSIAGFAGGGL